jgi:hypothetical protein
LRIDDELPVTISGPVRREAERRGGLDELESIVRDARPRTVGRLRGERAQQRQRQVAWIQARRVAVAETLRTGQQHRTEPAQIGDFLPLDLRDERIRELRIRRLMPQTARLEQIVGDPQVRVRRRVRVEHAVRAIRFLAPLPCRQLHVVAVETSRRQVRARPAQHTLEGRAVVRDEREEHAVRLALRRGLQRGRREIDDAPVLLHETRHERAIRGPVVARRGVRLAQHADHDARARERGAQRA